MNPLRGVDRSIISHFDKTPEGIHCPHFYEFKWAHGCIFSCSWCYLQGTFRYPHYKKQGDGSHVRPAVKPRERVQKALEAFLGNAAQTPGEHYLLNAGELSDSFLPGAYSLPELILSIDRWPENVRVLFLTKSAKAPDDVDSEWRYKFTAEKQLLVERVILSWTLNAYPVAKAWEKGTPDQLEKIFAAHTWAIEGFRVRFRIDPIVPVPFWQHEYFRLVDEVFSVFEPSQIERITLGTLRGLQSTINAASDKSWASYLDEKTPWGLKMTQAKRYEAYKALADYLAVEHKYTSVSVCKETDEMWKRLTDDQVMKQDGACNCTW